MGAIVPQVKLSDPGMYDANGNEVRFQYGINWVEALCPYVEKVTESMDQPWRCPAARTIRGSGTSRSAGVTYAMNANLTEVPEGLIPQSGSLMQVRELDRLFDSALRPTKATTSEKTRPNDPFLDQSETGTKVARYTLHDRGSNVLFADGHVKLFPASYFSKECEWDAKTGQWYNYTTLSDEDIRNRSICVSIPPAK